MSDIKTPVPSADSMTITLVGPVNFAPMGAEVPNYGVTSYTVPSENTTPSLPMSEGAVRVGNSVLNARVPESAILRDRSEDF